MLTIKNQLDEINKILFNYNTEEKTLIQEYLSRSIIGNYYLKPLGYKHNTHYTYTDYMFQNWDINLTTNHAVIEVKEREKSFDNGYFLEDKKLDNLLYCNKAYYVNYTLDDNKIYRWDINEINKKITDKELNPTTITMNKNTLISTDEKINKPVYLLSTEWADTYVVNDIETFGGVKLKLLKYLSSHPEKLTPIIGNNKE